MSAIRTALLATALVFAIVAFHTIYLSFLESPIRYEGLPWIKGAGRPVHDEVDVQFLVGVGKGDITG